MHAETLTMPRPKRLDRTVKIDARVARKASMIASYLERPLAEVLTELLRPAVDREFKKYRLPEPPLAPPPEDDDDDS